MLAKDREHFEVPDGLRLLHGCHPCVSIEAAGCGEAGEVPLEVVLMPAGLAFGVVYRKSLSLHASFFKPQKKTLDMLKSLRRFR